MTEIVPLAQNAEQPDSLVLQMKMNGQPLNDADTPAPTPGFVPSPDPRGGQSAYQSDPVRIDPFDPFTGGSNVTRD